MMYRCHRLLWTAILLILFGNVTLASDTPMTLFAEGIQELNRGEIDAAAKTFTRVTAIAPDFADAHYHLGLIYYQQSEFQKAIDAFANTLELLPRDVDALVKLGLALHKAGAMHPVNTPAQRRFCEQAVETYQTALDIQPHNVDALNNLGLAYQALGRFADAIAAYKEGLTLNPDVPQLRTNLAIATDLQAGLYSLAAYRHYQTGMQARRAGRIDRAMEAWKQAIQESPTYVQASRQLAELYFERGEYDLANRTYLSALRSISESDSSRRADRAAILYNLGNSYLYAGELEAALSAYQQAVDLVPEMGRAWANMGTVFLEMEQFDRAIAACRSAFRANTAATVSGENTGLAPSELNGITFTQNTAEDIKSGAYTMAAYRTWRRGVAARNRGDMPTAIKLWEQVAASHPRYAAAYENLAWTYFGLQRFQEAIHAAEVVQTVRPTPQIAQLLSFANDLKAGKYPFEAYQLWEQGRRTIAAGNPQDAAALFLEAIRIGPEFAAPYNTLAWLYADTLGTHLTEAEKFARRARQLSPEATHIQDTLGWVLYKQQRYTEALTVFEALLTQTPPNPEYLYHASLASMKTGRTDQALEYLTAAIALDKKFVQRARTQSEFDAVRFRPEFRSLLQ